ncbi:matrixin family metalloprotease [bacterium]|nr:matrixin family metalloprotease [bacterium]
MLNKKSGITPDRIIIIFICVIAVAFGIFVEFLPSFYFNAGKKCFDNQDYVAAYTNFSKAYNISKKDKKIRYYYTKTLTKLSPTIKIQKELFKISESNVNDSAKTTASIKIEDLRNRFTALTSDNYIEQVPSESGVIRWDLKSFPLKIAIKTDITGLPEYFEVQTLKALNQWRNSTKFVTFNIVENPEIANILIEFVPMPKDVCKENSCYYVVGNTVPTIKNGILKKMTITIYDKDPRGNYFSDKELYNTVLHEMGHALGIMGHSYNSDDLMYMSNENSNSIFSQYRSEFQYLSTSDLNTINLLYKMYPDVTNIAHDQIDKTGLIYAPIILGNNKSRSEKKLKEAENYIKKAPDIVNGYIDKAIALSELERVDEAIASLEKGLSISKRNEEKYVIYYNAAVIYINNKKPEQAKIYAQKAQQIDNSEEIQNLIKNINDMIMK